MEPPHGQPAAPKNEAPTPVSFPTATGLRTSGPQNRPRPGSPRPPFHFVPSVPIPELLFCDFANLQKSGKTNTMGILHLDRCNNKRFVTLLSLLLSLMRVCVCVFDQWFAESFAPKLQTSPSPLQHASPKNKSTFLQNHQTIIAQRNSTETIVPSPTVDIQISQLCQSCPL